MPCTVNTDPKAKRYLSLHVSLPSRQMPCTVNAALKAKLAQWSTRDSRWKAEVMEKGNQLDCSWDIDLLQARPAIKVAHIKIT
jgi:hypothetical protein